MQHVAIIDYGMGNLHSVASAVTKVCPEAQVTVTSSKSEIFAADRVIFPGVGAIGDCVSAMRSEGIDGILKELIGRKPILAICVGMQALFEHSAESGGVDCFGMFKGRVNALSNEPKVQSESLKVPHMGWNTVRQLAHPLWDGIEDDTRFYFLHSFYVHATDQDNVVGRTSYGVSCDVAYVQDGVFAVQFHPEKSGKDGLRLIKNFLKWDGV